MNICFYKLSSLTVNSKFSFSGSNATTVFSCAAIDSHVSGQHRGDDELVTALLVFIDHVVVILLQHFAILIPTNSGRGLANHNTIKADRIAVWNILTL